MMLRCVMMVDVFFSSSLFEPYHLAVRILVVVPIVGPVLLAMGLDPVWLGVMIAINLQTSFLTPPFGFALFYLRGVAPESIKTSDMYRGVVPFIILQLFLMLLLSLWPELATWLPSYIYS